MKQTLFFRNLIYILSVLAFVSCSKDDDNEPTIDPLEYETYIAVKLNVNENSKDKKIEISADYFNINWGDGSDMNYQGSKVIPHSYSEQKEYTVIITGKNVKEISLPNNGINEITIDNAETLTTLNCEENNLIALDIQKAKALTWLNCSSNQISSLNVKGHNALQSIVCESNQLTSLDLSNCIALKALQINKNPMTDLKVKNCTSLNILSVSKIRRDTSSIRLKTIDLSGCTALTNLQCENNYLTSLDLTTCPKLEGVTCQNNRLTSIKINNRYLRSLNCHSNLFTESSWRNIAESLPSAINDANKGELCAINYYQEEADDTLANMLQSIIEAKNWIVVDEYHFHNQQE